MPLQTTARITHLDKVRIDLDDAMQAAHAFYLRADDSGEPGRAAFEALIRAVSTLTLVVEAQEPQPVPEPFAGKTIDAWLG